jgi:phosphonate transport system substrate-binding protein
MPAINSYNWSPRTLPPKCRLLLTIFAFLLLAGTLAACNDSGETLVIAVQPSATQEELSDQASELEAFLEDRVDADVVLRFPTSYGGVVEALRFGHADAAFMSAWPASLANKNAGAEVVLAEIREVSIGEEKREEPFYYSYWVVPKDSAYDSLEELRDKKAAFPSQLSTSGFVAPTARLVELGLIEQPEDGEADPSGYFSEVIFAGGYSQAWESLKAGQVDVSVIAGDVPEDLYNEVLSQTKVIEEQGPIPSHAIVFSNEFQGDLRNDLLSALMELGDEQHRELMRKFVSGIFVRFEPTSTSEHLGSLNEYLDATGLSFQETLQ